MQGNKPLHVQGDEVVGRVRREGGFGSLLFGAGRLGGLGGVPVLQRETIHRRNIHGVKREREGGEALKQAEISTIWP